VPCMTCHLWRSQLIELARGRLPSGSDSSDTTERNRALAHVNVCPACSLFMEEQLGLTAAFEEFAADSDMVPPANLESIVLSEFDANKSFYGVHWKVAAAAIVAVAAALVWLAAIPHGHVIPSRVETAAAIRPAVPVPDLPVIKPVSKPVRRRAAKPAGDTEPFVAIPYTVPLDPRERAVVLRMDMPVTALVAVGLAVAAPDPRASAQTDVIVGEDGRIRAIRLLSISTSSSDRSVNP
jgi:hypothetical protein